MTVKELRDLLKGASGDYEVGFRVENRDNASLLFERLEVWRFTPEFIGSESIEFVFSDLSVEDDNP